MKEIKYYTSENIVEDVCVVYGVCYILKQMNNINYTLIRKNNCFTVEYDENEIDEDGLIYIDLTIEDCKNINSMYYTEIIKGALDKINNWFNNNIDNLLDDINRQDIINKTDNNTIAIGTHFYTVSKSFSSSGKIKTSSIKRNLALLGYALYSTFIKSSGHDINLLMIPKLNCNIHSITTPSQVWIYPKDKNKDPFITNKFPNKSEIEIEAIIYLKTLYQYYLEKDEYESIFIMQYKQTDNKPLADIYYNVDILEFNKDSYRCFENILNYSKNYNVKDITAKFILKNNYNNFSKMMRTYDKNDQKIEKGIGEEIINMYSDKVKSIFLNKSIQRLGQGLNILISKKRGYEILTQLYNISNESNIVKIISKLSDEYYRSINKTLLNSNDIEDIIKMLNDKKDAKIMADAIISYGRNFYIKKEDN